MRRIKSFFENQTFFGKNYKIFAIISSKSDIWQKMHVPCKNILDRQSLTAPCGRAAHHAQAAAGRIQLDVSAGAAPGHGVVGEGQAAGAVRIGISQRQPAVKGQREVARRGSSQVKADVVPAALPDVVVVTGEKVLSPTACGRSPSQRGPRKKKTASLRTRFVCCLLIPLSPLRGAGSQCPPAPSG